MKPQPYGDFWYDYELKSKYYPIGTEPDCDKTKTVEKCQDLGTGRMYDTAAEYTAVNKKYNLQVLESVMYGTAITAEPSGNTTTMKTAYCWHEDAVTYTRKHPAITHQETVCSICGQMK